SLSGLPFVIIVGTCLFVIIGLDPIISLKADCPVKPGNDSCLEIDKRVWCADRFLCRGTGMTKKRGVVARQ
ncbi:MAG TPA: hypothetical protein DCW73_02795, partial [Treponema sp.]|nr:hypothetical protein [Treponema sp.]